MSTFLLDDVRMKKLHELFFCFLITVFFFGINFLPEFATDTYATFQISHWQWMLYGNGRIVTAFVYFIIEWLSLSPNTIYALSYLGAIVFLALSTYIVSRVLSRYSGKSILNICISFLTVANIFSIEYFLFIEKALFLFALFLNTLAFASMECFFRKKKKRNLCYSFLCLLTAVFIYQITLGLFVILCLPFICLHSKTLKQFVCNNVIVALLYGTNLLIALITTRYLLNSQRIATNMDIDLSTIIRKLIDVTVNTNGILPKGCFILILLFILIIYGIVICHSSEKTIFLLRLFYITLGTIMVGFLPFYSGIYANYCPRVLYPYACLSGILLINLTVSNEGEKQHNRFLPSRAIIFAVTLFALFCQYFSFLNIFIDRYKCNQTDKYISEMIAERIKEYENESHNVIEYICFYKDASPSYSHRDLNSSNLSPRAAIADWSDLNSLNYYLNTSYVKGEPDPGYQAYFEKRNWDTYSDSQLIFDENTLHICVY